MAPNIAALEELVRAVEEFPIRDRHVKAVQREMREGLTHVLHTGDTVPTDLIQRYRAILTKYFSQFQKEALTHVRDIDKRLERLAQLQFNATAERGVAARRVELTKSVLGRFEEL